MYCSWLANALTNGTLLSSVTDDIFGERFLDRN